MLQLDQVTHTYDGHYGIRGVSLHVPRGSLFVVCGANGAGKTTLLSVVCGLLPPEGGRLSVSDPAAPAGRALLTAHTPRTGFGYLGDATTTDPHLSAWEWLGYAAAVKGAAIDLDEAALYRTTLELDGQPLDAAIHTLSFGNQRKVALWAEFLTTRSVLVLDEPLLGLDPGAIEGFNSAARRFVGTGRSILLSTHLLAEAEAIATHVAFLRDGELVRAGPRAEIVGDRSLRAAFLEGTG